LRALASLVVKGRVGLGGLPPSQHAPVLCLAWCALSAEVDLTEAQVNASLKQCLSEECRFLGVDHVELRRWLVDAGWLTRDGFGRVYRRVREGELPPGCASFAPALAGMNVREWVAGVRAAAASARAARRRAWLSRRGDAGQASG
jgi:hypothetical protein